MDFYSVVYLLVAWGISALAGAFRCIRNGDFQSIGHLVSVAGVSGFFGFGVVCVLVGDFRDPGSMQPFYLGISAIIGLAGKENTLMIEKLSKFIVEKFIGQGASK